MEISVVVLCDYSGTYAACQLQSLKIFSVDDNLQSSQLCVSWFCPPIYVSYFCTVELRNVLTFYLNSYVTEKCKYY